MKMRINLVSLGCLKNQADSEALVRNLRARGAVFSEEPAMADVLLINTCGFIEDAKRESIAEILDLAAHKQTGQKLVVLGCLARRHGEELQREIPEIDALFGPGEGDAIASFIAGNGGIYHAGGIPGEGAVSGCEFTPNLGPRHVAPIKVAEGCNRRCTFCVIPSIRGRFKSRGPDEVLREAESYVAAGVKELVLVAQDLTAFGRGHGGYGLLALVRDMAAINGDFWIRLHYLYPATVDEQLLEVMAREEKVVNYVDVPLQHSEDRILKAMGRAGTRRGYLRLLGKIRRAVPGVTLRTAFIVGFPGETRQDFEGLLDFVQEAGFDRLGAFLYSKEDGTPASRLPGHLPRQAKQERYDELMGLQTEISREKNQDLVGRRFRALVDSVDGSEATARLPGQGMDIDGVTRISGVEDRGIQAGQFVEVEITAAQDHDLEGVCV